MKGKVIKYNKKNIDTDLIIPARHLVSSDPDHLAEHCFEDLDPEFNQKKTQLGISIVVADSNFGSGSSREQAPLALKAAGIKCVIAPSFARIFFRNAINIGLPIIELKEIDGIHNEHELEIDFENGIIYNLTTNKQFKINKMPDFLHDIISADGLVNFARNKILKN
ncbi:MAG: 3-isopropylmalate dehydratase small subunit [Promethearchaeota archaeon]|nr:MAG: 3-isopropylmalate dehydratase small subunit [Candidatus Lokiarchaeota archaeon]